MRSWIQPEMEPDPTRPTSRFLEGPMATPKRGGATYGTVTTKKSQVKLGCLWPKRILYSVPTSLLLQQTSSPKISADWAWPWLDPADPLTLFASPVFVQPSLLFTRAWGYINRSVLSVLPIPNKNAQIETQSWHFSHDYACVYISSHLIYLISNPEMFKAFLILQ
jgi:hypothetical protein